MNNIYKLYIFSDKDNSFAELEIENLQMVSVFSLENIQDITTRKDNLTKELNIKGTKHNNQILGNLYDISRYSEDTFTEELQHNFRANQKIRCILLENNIEIVKGNILISDIQINNGNIIYISSIIGELVSFFNELKEKTLSDLDSINDNITFNLTSISNTWNNSIDQPYLFPSIDYGADDRPNSNDDQGKPTIEPNWYDSSFDIRNFRPAIPVKRYIDSIFRGFRYDEANNRYTQWDENNNLINRYKYQSEFFNSDSFKKLFIPHNEEEFTKNVSGVWSTKRYGSGELGKEGEYLFLKRNYSFPNTITQKDNDNFIYGTRSIGFQDIQKNIPWFEAKDKNLKTSLKITYDLRVTGGLTGNFITGLADVRGENNITANNLKFFKKFTKTSTADITYPIEIIVDDAVLDGQFVMGIFREDGQFDAHFNIGAITIEFGKSNTISKLPVKLGDTIKLFDMIPKEIKLQEFLKSIMTLFNLYMIQDPSNNNNWIIEPYHTSFADVINLDRNKAIDWTNKIDFKDYNLSTNINLPKSYTYKFTEETDMMNDYYKNLYNKTYGELTVYDSKGIAENKEIEVIFAPTININHSLNKKMLPCIYKSNGFLQGRKKQFKSKLRILYNNGILPTGETYDVYYRGAIAGEFYTYQFSSMFNVDISTNNVQSSLLFDLPNEYYTNEYIVQDEDLTIYKQYYHQQLNRLTNENIIIAEFQVYLNETDISNLDFRIPIFIQSTYGNSYFKLLEVEYSNHYTPSTIKVMKIVN